MPKKRIRSEFRVEVQPRSPGDFGCGSLSGMTQTEKEWEQDCEAIADQIRRHVDGLSSGHGRGVSVAWDSEFVCGYCGGPWTEDGETYNGYCCDDDEKNNPENARNVT